MFHLLNCNTIRGENKKQKKSKLFEHFKPYKVNCACDFEKKTL